MDATRVDRWLWSVRAFKTRSVATGACQGGHVKVNGTTVKPAHPVRLGDRVEVTGGARRRELVVLQIIEKRVGPPLAAACYRDDTPPDPLPESFIRDVGAGRPTKRDRRRLDRLRRS